ncbi:hypothetical protein DFR58_11465 [Anaerobacterium chartisolvens]|uniref:Thioredoxin-like protein n=1 Tax=Anaerobacterium chartisolvens TaxID=1297424 RepID=A0A369B0A2_9FIRM|nr:hypothetical protein [Anaerobacterium chartisolvens]RCX14831.1 hypothetical protein DFR58_11465 [Anaerobacterium chartisolvens]
MKRYVFLIVPAVAALIIGLAVYAFHPFNRLELKSGDVIPSGIKFFNASGGVSRAGDIGGKYRVFFYLDSTDSACMERLNCISKVINLISVENISYAVVWEDSIPVESIAETGIDLSFNYSLNRRASLSESRPDAFLTDENGKIIMITGYSYVSLINEIIALGGKKDLSVGAAEMILKNASEPGASLGDNGGKTLLMFVSSGCRTCRETEEIVRQNIDSMYEKINVITVRPDFDTRQPYDRHFEIDPQQVYFNIFTNAQGIEASKRKYPLFFIINSDYSVERLFTDAGDTVKHIMG